MAKRTPRPPAPVKYQVKRFPSLTDPRWREWTFPLWSYLAKHPRTWGELMGWAHMHECDEEVRQYLAWLEAYGKADTSINSDGVLRWYALGQTFRPRTVA